MDKNSPKAKTIRKFPKIDKIYRPRNQTEKNEEKLKHEKRRETGRKTEIDRESERKVYVGREGWVW